MFIRSQAMWECTGHQKLYAEISGGQEWIKMWRNMSGIVKCATGISLLTGKKRDCLHHYHFLAEYRRVLEWTL